MKGEWVVLNSVQEGDEGADPNCPWYPSLYIPNHCWPSFEVWFATEDECRDFIEECVLGATLEEL